MALVTKRNVFPGPAAGHVNMNSLPKNFVNHWGSCYLPLPHHIVPFPGSPHLPPPLRAMASPPGSDYTLSATWGPINGRSLEDQAPRYLIHPVPSCPSCWPQTEQTWLWVISFHVLNQRHRDNNFPNIVLRDAYHCKTIFCHQAVSKGQCHLAETHTGW